VARADYWRARWDADPAAQLRVAPRRRGLDRLQVGEDRVRLGLGPEPDPPATVKRERHPIGRPGAIYDDQRQRLQHDLNHAPARVSVQERAAVSQGAERSEEDGTRRTHRSSGPKEGPGDPARPS
jgi:hypothetical protein